MTSFRTLTLVTLALSSAAVFAQCAAAPPQALLQQMDAASARFKNAQADVTYDIYTRAVRDHSLQSGSIFVERSGATNQMGAVTFNLGPDGKPAKSPDKIIAYDGSTLQMATVQTNQVDVFKAGQNQAKYEGFLTLGFGGSGKALSDAWCIQDQGVETLADGATQVKTEKLDLVAKDPSLKDTFTHVTIWIDPTRDISLKQIFFAPNNDSRTTLYANIRLNGKINKSPYTIPKSAKRIQH